MYQGKVYREQGGDCMRVADGGSIVVDSGGQINVIAPGGNIWFVDSTVAASGDGKSWGAAFKTITEAVAAAAAAATAAGKTVVDDEILIRGTFTESVVVGLAGLAIRGVGNTPRQAKWSPASGNDKVNLTINAAYVRVSGIYFQPGPKSATYSACIVLGTAAAYARIIGNRFQGSTGAYYGIYSPAVGADNVHIVGNEFAYFNTATYGAAIRGVNAGGFQYSTWHILDNVFEGCVTAIKLSCRMARIERNAIAEYGVNAAGAVAQLLALGIDLSGDDATNSGANVVCGNQLGGTYDATLYKVGAAGDQWAGNYNVLTGGVTAANPA